MNERFIGFGQYSWQNTVQNEEELREEEIQEAEIMIRNGSNLRQIMRKRFTFVEQSDIFKLYRKYGREPEDT